MPSSAMMALMVLEDLPPGQLKEGVVAMVVNPSPKSALVYVYDSYERTTKVSPGAPTPLPGYTIKWFCVCKKRLWFFYRTRLGNSLVLCELKDGTVGRLGDELIRNTIELSDQAKEKL